MRVEADTHTVVLHDGRSFVLTWDDTKLAYRGVCPECGKPMRLESYDDGDDYSPIRALECDHCRWIEWLDD